MMRIVLPVLPTTEITGKGIVRTYYEGVADYVSIHLASQFHRRYVLRMMTIIRFIHVVIKLSTAIELIESTNFCGTEYVLASVAGLLLLLNPILRVVYHAITTTVLVGHL